MSPEAFLAQVLGAFLAQLLVGGALAPEVRRLREWAVRVSDHLHLARPEGASRKDRE